MLLLRLLLLLLLLLLLQHGARTSGRNSEDGDGSYCGLVAHMRHRCNTADTVPMSVVRTALCSLRGLANRPLEKQAMSPLLVNSERIVFFPDATFVTRSAK